MTDEPQNNNDDQEQRKITNDEFVPILKEFELLRMEIVGYHDQIFKLENYAVVGIGTLYAWLVYFRSSIMENGSIIIVIFLSPILFLHLARSRVNVYKHRIARLAIYVGIVESEMNLRPGWEHFVWHSRAQATGDQNAFNPIFVIDTFNIKTHKKWESITNKETIDKFSNSFQDFWCDTMKMWRYLIIFCYTMSITLIIISMIDIPVVKNWILETYPSASKFLIFPGKSCKYFCF